MILMKFPIPLILFAKISDKFFFKVIVILTAVILTGCGHLTGSRPLPHRHSHETNIDKHNGVVVKSGPVYDAQQELLAAFVKAFAEGDAEGCAGLYTEDTIYMQADLPIERGRDVVLKGYAEFFANRPNKLIEISEPIEEVISFGNMAVVRGAGKNVEETPEGGTVIKTYKYMILSEQQEDGSWQMKWDIYNFDDDY